jgi:hypothetical protein
MGFAFRPDPDVYQALQIKKSQKRGNTKKKMQNAVNYSPGGIAMNFLGDCRILASQTL